MNYIQRAVIRSSVLSPVLASLLALGCSTPPIALLEPAELQARCERDLEAARLYRKGLQSVVAFVQANPKLFPMEDVPDVDLPGREKRKAVRETWKRLLEYQLALDSLGGFHKDWDEVDVEPERSLSFLVQASCFLSGYRHAQEFIAAVEKSPALSTVLDEPIPEIGLAAGTYSRYKKRFLNVVRVTEFAALRVALRVRDEMPVPEINAGIAEDSSYLWKLRGGKGLTMTVSNALEILGGWGYAAWFPVQTGISIWMGDTTVRRKGRTLISPEQKRVLREKLEPGDIVLTRREWYLTNVGLPGFWPHAALYVGTPEERRKFFDDDGVRAWVKAQGQDDGDLEALIRLRHIKNYESSLGEQKDGDEVRFIEAISEGVSLTTLTYSAAADSLVAFRPRLPKSEKAYAILEAFRFAGRPYDFDFDFLTDETIVCTELVFKSYEPDPAKGKTGIRFPWTEVLGRPVMPANLIVRQFDENFGTDKQQLDFVAFLDGYEDEGIAIEADLTALRESWKRPKWHIFTQEELE